MDITKSIDHIELKHDHHTLKVRFTTICGNQVTVVGRVEDCKTVVDEQTPDVVRYDLENFTVGKWEDD